jgi:miniconductance mechanosensitive channel
MVSSIHDFLINSGVAQNNAVTLSFVITVAVYVVISALVILIVNKIILRLLAPLLKKFKWSGIMLEHKVFHRITYVFPAAMIYAAASQFSDDDKWFQRAAGAYAIFASLFVLVALLDSIQDFYGSFELHKTRPIKGLIQVLKIVVFGIGAITIIATLMGESPMILLTGVGAFSAVLILIFKDSLLGLVAGIQLSADDMLRIGDWITMDKYNADGDVIDITLNTVKVENFDHTITTIPAYALISDSFVNWRNMQNIGARRIKRSLNIDINSVAFCSEEMLSGMQNIQYLSEFLKQKKEEIALYNQNIGANMDEAANGRRLTNLGLFRIFLANYLENNPHIHQEMSQIVRQLPPTETGIPIEVYAFTNDIEWASYEAVQADLFDYIIAIAPRFGLRIYQNPAGFDVQNRAGN